MSGWANHLVIVPILRPLLAGSTVLLLDERTRALRAGISLAATLALVVVAGALLRMAGAAGFDSPANVYLLGDWPAPFGIVLVLDKLSALMLMLTSILAVASLVFSLARRSEEHTSELQSLIRISYAVFCLKKKTKQ